MKILNIEGENLLNDLAYDNTESHKNTIFHSLYLENAFLNEPQEW